MKQLLSFFITISVFSGFGFSYKSKDASQKVMEVFSQTFKDAKDVKWLINGDESTATFIDNDIRTSITYDKNAAFLSSRRYYGESKLPFNVLLKIKAKYKPMKIGIVTEIIEDGAITYAVNLEDEQSAFVVESDGNANIKHQSKFRKQKGLESR